MGNLIKAELTITGKRKASWIVLGVLIVFLALNYLLTYFALDIPALKELLLPGNVWEFSLFQLGNNGLLIAAIFGGLFFGSPFGWRTYETRFTLHHGRSKIFTAKLAAVLLVFGFWLFVAIFFAHLISFLLGFLAGSLAYSIPGLWLVIRGLLLVTAVWAVWFLLGGTISLWSKSTSLSIGLALAYYFLENIIFAIPGFSDLIGEYSFLFLGEATSEITFRLFPGETFLGDSPMGGPSAGLGKSLAVVLCYIFVFALLGWWRFKTMELPEE